MGKAKFVLFLKASGKLGLGSVILTLTFLLVGVVEHLRNKNIPTIVFVALAFSFLIIGSYLAWSAEHEKLLKEQSRRINPDFLITASSVVVGLLDSHNTVLVKVTVVNKEDSPSTIKNYFLRQTVSSVPSKAIYFDHATLPTDRTQHSVVMTEDGVSYGNKRVMVELRGLLGEDKQRAWSKNVHQEGWLCFQLQERLTSHNGITSLWLQIEDAIGEMHYSEEQVCRVEQKPIFW